MKPTREQLAEFISYDPETGRFSWLQTGTGRKPGCVGWMTKFGYVRIGIGRRTYSAHRLAWLIMTGEWPANEIDHVNLCKSDNRWSNLREATPVDNCRNRRCRADSGNGLKGVNYRKDRKSRPWQARIVCNGRRHSLGFFETPSEAYAAYVGAAIEGHGSFVRVD